MPNPETPQDGTQSTIESGQLRIDAPELSRPDEEITVQITGADGGERVNFEATIEDADGVDWRSRATFIADSDGTVDLAAQAPTSGTYEGVRTMGWLWSMQADDEDQMVTELMDAETRSIHLQASTDEQTANCKIRRGFEGEQITRKSVDKAEFTGMIFEPEEGPSPGVLVLHGSSGNPVDFEAALLASHGFSAFALQYAGNDEMLPDRIDRIPVTYFEQAARWFRSRPAVSDEQLGIVGRSRGGEIGLYLGARAEWVGPVISYVGSPVIWDTPHGESAWVDEDGNALPYVSGQQKPTLTEGQLDEAEEGTRRTATTPVEDIDGPVLFISGGKDPIWPARRLAEIGMDRLETADRSDPCEHLTYDSVGHFITPPYVPKTHAVFNGTAGAIARADADSWPTVLDCLRDGFENPPTGRAKSGDC